MGDQRLRPVERLRCPRAYQRVFEQGEKLVGSLFILYVLPTSEPYSRLGIAVSKRWQVHHLQQLPGILV